MPFPWKKVKANKLSQFVNDHLQHSQKRRDGSSLVVETGFPTSLIDLFMKNREKLKKNQKKKRDRPSQIPLPVVANDDDDDEKVILVSPPPMFGSPLPSLPLENVDDEIDVMESSDDVFVVVEDEDERDERKKVGVENANGVLLVVAKMFLVVALASGTQRFTIGMMLSAFVLFFLEYVGKRLSGLMNARSEAKGVLGLVVRVFGSLLRLEEDKSYPRNARIVKQDAPLNALCSSPKNFEGRCLVSEIQMVEPKDELVTRVEEVRYEKDVVDCSGFEGRLRYQEIESEEVAMEKEESKKRKSRRLKLKSKMKKLVKLRNCRKEEEEEEEQHPRKIKVVRRDCVVDFQEQELDHYVYGGKSENGMSGRDKAEDGTSDFVSFVESSYTNFEASTNREEEGKEIEPGLIWRYLGLCLIVLIGLIGDRAFALLLTLSWLLLLKLGEKLDGKVPIIRSFKKS